MVLHLTLVIPFLLWAAPVQGAFVQYKDNPSLEVTGGNDAGIVAIPKHGILVVTEAFADIVWPAPSGCAEGHWSWSRVVSPWAPTIVFALRPGLAFFNCRRVKDAAEAAVLRKYDADKRSTVIKLEALGLTFDEVDLLLD